MCGLLGGINVDSENLNKSKIFLRHRGPDETGEFRDGPLYLYHARLSIQDIETGQQPFVHGDHVIIFNGEIYNHFDLRRIYNLKCKTRSDTETLLLLFMKLGREAMTQLDGMFAFAIFNTKTRKLFLARDRAGEKPLYYFRRDGKFAFASELNALTGLITAEINPDSIYQYLRYGFTGSFTPYRDIFELEAGCWMEINLENYATESGRWWNIQDFVKRDNKLSFSGNLEKVDALLHQSVRSRLENSDLEVGTFLSGGIDSGLVTAIASQYKSGLKTFTVSFDGQYDEAPLAQLVARKFNTHHTTIRLSFDDLLKNLENILANYGEPFADSSAIPSWYVSREAKKYLTVILNGDGADELFGGYRRYVPFSKYDIFKSGPVIRGISRILSGIMPYPDDKKNAYNYLFRLAELAGKDALHAYLSSTVDTFEGYEKHLKDHRNPFPEIKNLLESMNQGQFTGLNKIMILDFWFLFANDLLVKMDIATMAHSLEGRTPFLSKEILEFAPSIPDEYKINRITTKFLLRKLASRYLPRELVSQPKRGFEVPLKQWMNHELREITQDYLSGGTFSENFIGKDFITNLLENRVQVPPEKRAKMLWTMLALEIWHRKCFLTKNTSLSAP